MYQSGLNQPSPVLTNSSIPVTCTLPIDQSDSIVRSMIILEQLELDMSEWYSYSTLSSVEALFAVQFK